MLNMRKWMMLALLMLSLLVVVGPLAAQEATPAAETAPSPAATPVAPGLPILVILMGFGAVAAVGGIMIYRDQHGQTD